MALCRTYNSDTAEEDLKVKEPYFRFIFNRFYNLRFGSPRVDLAEQLKSCMDEERRASLIIEKRVHKLKSEAFHNLIKEDRIDLLILTFDCQKNQPFSSMETDNEMSDEEKSDAEMSNDSSDTQLNTNKDSVDENREGEENRNEARGQEIRGIKQKRKRSRKGLSNPQQWQRQVNKEKRMREESYKGLKK
ncbi:hypothetical protein J6590_087553 [Homalodisca vitripennis]|nr:hypothetical protein J6590_087553 [Homalodisca vitripennis]